MNHEPPSQDGAFQVYRGVPPEATFHRVKQYLLRLEGIFRLMPKASILQSALYEQGSDEPVWRSGMCSPVCSAYV